ncbi:DCAF10 [Branchiostoma lanceolatum]|uniref:DDB1- and CUL4-associated factor 10 n=1 Tax=Branchiostoma lanceolatum TaxID=7740 RepID=A0A8J9ZPI1_BRALA|nr:DCAF10 [Branchiostoma lanceolatum]
MAKSNLRQAKDTNGSNEAVEIQRFCLGWLKNRELGRRRGCEASRAQSDFIGRVYPTLQRTYWPGAPIVEEGKRPHTHGAVFNLEFSPDGKVLAAACEHTDVLLYDPLTTRQFHKMERAHLDCVNCIRYMEDGCSHERVFHTHGLMRTRLTPDGSKMVMSTAMGYLIVIHDLDLSTMSEDLKFFNAANYMRWYHIEQMNPEQDTDSLYFRLPKNRVEIVTDFVPTENYWYITSLQVHPQGWCSLSRYTSPDDDSEWTCVHDLQDSPKRKPYAHGQKMPPHQTRPRLTHFIEEANVGRGFIKELCFSDDGRLVCSPFGYGVRLLAFDPKCSELCDCHPDTPVQLYEVKTVVTHADTVLTTKFSPVHCMLVSGCLSGKICFYQPAL